jgi:hypothetical protein
MRMMTHNNQILIATERERWLKLHLEGGMTINQGSSPKVEIFQRYPASLEKQLSAMWLRPNHSLADCSQDS